MNGEDGDDRDELASLYALGVIDSAGVAALRQQLQAAPGLAADLGALVQAAIGLAQAIPLIDPPLALRARVLSSVTGRAFGLDAEASAIAPRSASPAATIARPGASRASWLAAAAALAAAIGASAYALQLRDRIGIAEQRASYAERELVDLRRALIDAEGQTQRLRMQAAVLVAPDMARVDLAGQAPAPGALARAFWSRTRGMVFTATALPALPADKVYQLWVVTNGQPPVSAGLLAPDAQGGVNAHFVTPPDVPTPVALAVTLEPAGGVSQPTGEKYLVGLTGL